MVRLVTWCALLAVVALTLAPSGASAQGGPFEVWVVDQADADKGGAKIYIYPGTAVRGQQLQGQPQVVDLNAAAQGVGHGPGVRPHLLEFNSTHSHGVLAYVASGHVQVIRAADRRVVASIDVGEQAHGAVVSPDDSIILVANQNGKKLARIRADFQREQFTHNPAEDLDLKALENPAQPDNAPICPLLFVDSRKAYVTLRGGGLYIVDVASTPMRVLRQFTKDQVAPAGCGGVVVSNKIYINSGTANSSDLYVFDAASDSLVKHIPFTPIGRDGHGLVVIGKYLWMGNRASANIAVIDTTTDTHVHTIGQLGAAPDIMSMSPNGDQVFVALRGPNNLTGGPPAKGQTPGVAALAIDGGGLYGWRSLFAAIGDQSPASPVDPHGLAVRRGVAAPRLPAALPRTGELPLETAAPLAALLGIAALGLGAWLGRGWRTGR